MRTSTATAALLYRPTSAYALRLVPSNAPDGPVPAGTIYSGSVLNAPRTARRDGRARRSLASQVAPVQTIPPAWLLSIRGRSGALLCLAIVLVDQASKAVQAAGTFIVNTGGPAILPSPLGDALWNSPTFGAACDTVDTVLLVAALGMARKLTNRWQRVTATAVLAGLLSNLVDRLGGSSLFHAGLPRGCIDWIVVPAWPTARANIADVIITLGAVAFIYRPARHTIHAIHALARRSRAARLAAATTGLIAVAVWTTIWQANRHTADLRVTTRSETAAPCPAVSHPSDGMDWLSYRPTAGPRPYGPPTPRQAVGGCATTTRATGTSPQRPRLRESESRSSLRRS